MADAQRQAPQQQAAQPPQGCALRVAGEARRLPACCAYPIRCVQKRARPCKRPFLPPAAAAAACSTNRRTLPPSDSTHRPPPNGSQPNGSSAAGSRSAVHQYEVVLQQKERQIRECAGLQFGGLARLRACVVGTLAAAAAATASTARPALACRSIARKIGRIHEVERQLADLSMSLHVNVEPRRQERARMRGVLLHGPHLAAAHHLGPLAPASTACRRVAGRRVAAPPPTSSSSSQALEHLKHKIEEESREIDKHRVRAWPVPGSNTVIASLLPLHCCRLPAGAGIWRITTSVKPRTPHHTRFCRPRTSAPRRPWRRRRRRCGRPRRARRS